MITLAIDASTYVGTTALIDDGQLVAEGEALMRGRETEALMPAIADVLASARICSRDLGRIVCGAGPGSFTSLRIAASIAKGLALGAGCPMFAVSSLALLVAASVGPRAGRYLAVLDALRGDAYVGAYAVDAIGTLSVIRSESLVMHSNLPTMAQELGATTVGVGQKIEGAPRASGILGLDVIMHDAPPIDLPSWEPDYGRKAEAQSRWEATHGCELPAGGSSL